MNSNNIILIKKSTEEVCWTCNKKPATKSEYRDSLGENEMTCADCHREEYPEQYEEEATICWDGETCKPDEFGCCVVCCECKACICNLQKAEEEEECTDENKCGECTYCARTKVCEYCGCVGGCDSSCRGDIDIEYDCPKCGYNRGDHDVSKRNRLIPCESDGEGEDEEEYVCKTCDEEEEKK